jgi:hypothetical protein
MNRRTFIHSAGSTSLGLGSAQALSDPDRTVAPLIELLESSPRDSLPRELVRRFRDGVRYEELLTALSVAAVRNVQPYPDVGFKYHAIMVLRSIHLTTQHLPEADRWLPIVWAADYFKNTQAQERVASGWHMPERIPSTGITVSAARRRLVAALDRWDRDAADAAIVDYASLAPADEIFGLLFAYGARDLRAIGHKAISVCNAHTLVSLLGAAHAAPILRSTVAALQNSDDDADPATHDLPPDRPYRHNERLLPQIPQSWKLGRNDAGARAELRAALYRASEQDAGAAAVDMLRNGMSADAVWQVLFDTAAELTILQPSILTLHAQTSANALHYAYRFCADERTQQLALLQCAAFVAMFCAMAGATERGFRLEAEEPLFPKGRNGKAIEEIFSDVSGGNRRLAARKTLGYLRQGGDPQPLIAAIRHHFVYHAGEPHDYKFPEAVLDSYASLPDLTWRSRFLGAGMSLFKAPAPRPGRIVEETLELLEAPTGSR